MTKLSIYILLLIIVVTTTGKAGIRPVGWTKDGEFVIIRELINPHDLSITYRLEVIDVFNNKTIDEEYLCSNIEPECVGQNIEFLLNLSEKITKNYLIEIDTAIKLHTFPYTINKFNYTYDECELVLEQETSEKPLFCEKEFIKKYNMIMHTKTHSYSIYSCEDLTNVVNVELSGFYKSPNSYLFALVLVITDARPECKKYSYEQIVGFAALPEEE